MAEPTVCSDISKCAKLPGDVYRVGVAAGVAFIVEQIEGLKAVHSALDQALGDTDPWVPETTTDEELKDEEPVLWAAQKLASLIQAIEAAKSDHTAEGGD